MGAKNNLLLLILALCLTQVLTLLFESKPAQAQEPELRPTSVTIYPSSFTVESRENQVLTVTLTSEGKPLAGKRILFEAETGSFASPLEYGFSETTDANGQLKLMYRAPAVYLATSDTIHAYFRDELYEDGEFWEKLYEDGKAVATATITPHSTSLVFISPMTPSITVHPSTTKTNFNVKLTYGTWIWVRPTYDTWVGDHELVYFQQFLSGRLITWSTSPPGAGSFSSPSGITTDWSGEVLTDYTAPSYGTEVTIIASFAGDSGPPPWGRRDFFPPPDKEWGFAASEASITVKVLGTGGDAGQDDMGTGGDAGYEGALIPSSITGTGYIDEYDSMDVYKIYVSSGQTTTVTMTPPSGADFDLYIWEPGLAASLAEATTREVALANCSDASLKRGLGTWETVTATATVTGHCYISVLCHSGSGTYSMEVLTAVGSPALAYITEPAEETSPVIPFIEPGNPATVEFENVDITTIKISVENLVSNVEVKVKVLAEKPPELIKAPGWVYEYFEVLTENLKGENVEIEFKVEKASVDNIKIKAENIALCMYDNSENMWIRLPTQKIDEDGYIYFRAVSPHLSMFAITARVPEAELSLPPSTPPGLVLEAIAAIVLIGAVVALYMLRFRPRRRGG